MHVLSMIGPAHTCMRSIACVAAPFMPIRKCVYCACLCACVITTLITRQPSPYFLCVYVCIRVCMCVYLYYLYIRTHTCIYTYIHTHNHVWRLCMVYVCKCLHSVAYFRSHAFVCVYIYMPEPLVHIGLFSYTNRESSPT